MKTIKPIYITDFTISQGLSSGLTAKIRKYSIESDEIGHLILKTLKNYL